ncbi:glycoside hydrolase family 3 N-terminal domain-containing protein [Telluria beijingensis]|uniref:glycoside hydrolase family 3 N-terminal domain-containing protein n=1 Tax=Telluria beijingensis TaxID=3068633 RepID=UPI002795EC2B|nr:glycoside hydrolase family 3 N-terminal domain-containing protein [Massilia sp. REN29]
MTTMTKTLLALAALMACVPSAFAQERTIAQQVDALLKRMTLEEKVGQLHQLSGRQMTGPGSEKFSDKLADIRAGKVGSMLNVKGVAETREIQALALQSRLKIPLLFSLDVIHGYKTVFPVPLGESASWDMEAIEQSAHIAAKEAAASGIHWTFAPMVDIGRDPRWGRVMEGAGEDTYLGSRIAVARVKGFQGERPGALDRIMATAKHFAGYGAAIAGRDYNAADMSEQQLHEVYLPPFKAAVDAGVATFMNSFNTLNGVPATASSHLQRDILKGQWKYPGFVVSDWASVKELVEHGYATDLAQAAEQAINAGSDMDMEGYAFTRHLAERLKSGKVKQDVLDDAVRRVLTKKFELGLFDDPYRYSDAAREQAVLNDPEHARIARDVARKSLVLLKNEGQALPFSTGLKSLAVIGPLAQAKRDLEGGWIVASDESRVVSLVEGIRARLSPQTTLTVARGCDVACLDTAGFDAAVAAAKDADAVLLVLGESWDMSGEAKSRADIGLPGRQAALFDAVAATGKPVVVVMLAGRPLVFENVAAKAAAIVYAWFPGAQGGNAVADVLFGAYNPSGKLPMTFPRSVGQIPISYQQYRTGRPVLDPANIVYRSAYIDSPNTPRYAFGHGLSYTSFAYSDLALSQPSMRPGDKVTLSFTLANTGQRAGEEVAQLYLRDPVASIVRPLMELKGFQKLKLEPGERRRVSFEIDRDLLSFHNGKLDWVAEPGEFELMVGTASDAIRLRGKLTLVE